MNNEGVKNMEESAKKIDKKIQPARSVSKQITLGLLTFYSNLGPSMSLGFSAVSLQFLKEFLDVRQLSWFASIASLATPFGCFISGPVADRYGRRRAIYFVNIVCFFGWVMIALACWRGNNYLLLMVGRTLTGFSTGLSSSPATIYMAEVSSCHLRGVFTTWASISFSVGVLLVYLMGFIFKDDLTTICLLTAVLPCIGFMITKCVIPESPVWLVRKNRLNEAKINMSKIFGRQMDSSDVNIEMDMLIKSKEVKLDVISKSPLQQFLQKIKYLSKPYCMRPIALILTFFFFQQFSGTFVLIFYATDIVKKSGITFDAYSTIVLIGFARLLGAILASVFSRLFGRRPLSIFSGISMSLCLLLLANWIYSNENDGKSNTNSPILPILLFVVYFITNAIGFLPLPFAMGAELFPTKIRGTASGFVSGVGYMFNFVVVKIYPDMISIIGSKGVFFVYGCVAIAGTVFVSLLLPETRGKSLKQIEDLFKTPRELKNENIDKQVEVDSVEKNECDLLKNN